MPRDQQAFPGVTNDGYQLGMTLRDWFAGQYLAGFAARQDSATETIFIVARDAYNYADGLIAERKRHMQDETTTPEADTTKTYGPATH